MKSAIIGLNAPIEGGKDTVAMLIMALIWNQNIKHGLYSDQRIVDWIETDSSALSTIKNQSIWKNRKWAYKLKQVASLFLGVDIELFEDKNFKKNMCYNITTGKLSWRKDLRDSYTLFDHVQDSYPPNCWITIRVYLQDMGTNGLRERFPNIHVNGLMADYKPARVKVEDEEYETVYPSWVVSDTRFPNEAEAIREAGGILIRINRPENPHVSGQGSHISETDLQDYPFNYVIENDSTLLALLQAVKEILYKEGLLTPKKQPQNELIN